MFKRKMFEILLCLLIITLSVLIIQNELAAIVIGALCGVWISRDLRIKNV